MSDEFYCDNGQLVFVVSLSHDKTRILISRDRSEDKKYLNLNKNMAETLYKELGKLVGLIEDPH